MITLYHGSNVRIESIDLGKCKPYKDFGKGFYLADIEEQAVQMAVRRTRIAGVGVPTVSAYRFDERFLDDASLKVKKFDSPSREWALFVLANRQGRELPAYDIVLGPVADDGVVFQLERYLQGMISLDVLVEELTYRKLNRQYFFGSEAAISKLKRL